jgi:hypothetical protein
MGYPIDNDYYIDRKPELLKKFEKEAKYWSPLIVTKYGEIQTYKILQDTRQEFENLIPQIPYIGGKDNNFTKNLLDSVCYLALYKAMKKFDKTVEEVGRILYNACVIKYSEPLQIPPGQRLSTERLMERSRKAAARSQEKRYPGDYVYTFVDGHGKKFDNGLDFTECASLKFYQAHGADELLPFYCYLDFVAAKARGFGFTRTMTLYEGHGKCNHRFKAGGKTKAEWPPPFLKGKKR